MASANIPPSWRIQAALLLLLTKHNHWECNTRHKEFYTVIYPASMDSRKENKVFSKVCSEEPK